MKNIDITFYFILLLVSISACSYLFYQVISALLRIESTLLEIEKRFYRYKSREYRDVREGEK